MEGHFLLIKRILIGIIVLIAVAIVGYAVYAFYFVPKINYGIIPQTAEQKLRVLDDLSQTTGGSTITTGEKEKILNSLNPDTPESAGAGSNTNVAPAVAPTPDTQSQEVLDKIKLLESLQSKTQ